MGRWYPSVEGYSVRYSPFQQEMMCPAEPFTRVWHRGAKCIFAGICDHLGTNDLSHKSTEETASEGKKMLEQASGEMDVVNMDVAILNMHHVKEVIRKEELKDIVPE